MKDKGIGCAYASSMNNNVDIPVKDSTVSPMLGSNLLKTDSLGSGSGPKVSPSGCDGMVSEYQAGDDVTTKMDNCSMGEQTPYCKEGGVYKRTGPTGRGIGSYDSAAEKSQETRTELERANQVPTRLQIIFDPANMCTFSGAILAVLALASMWTGRYYLGMFFNVAANIADIMDGPIARSMPHRLPAFSVVGSKLDCYADLVSHFVVPASLLMHIGDLSLFPVLLAGVYVCSGIMRQSYFEITGRCEGGQCIFGLTSDYMVGIYTLTMHLHPLIGSSSLLMISALVVTIIFMIFCSLTFSLRSRRYDGLNLLLVTLYNIILCCSCGLLAVYSGNPDRLVSISTVSLPLLIILAYPLYFRHVEINH